MVLYEDKPTGNLTLTKSTAFRRESRQKPSLNRTPLVGQYGILNNKWGVFYAKRFCFDASFESNGALFRGYWLPWGLALRFFIHGFALLFSCQLVPSLSILPMVFYTEDLS